MKPTARAITAAPPTRREAGLPDAGLVFCSFNNTYKISPETFALWMRILQRCPGSVLWLLEDTPQAQNRLQAAAQAQGVAAANRARHGQSKAERTKQKLDAERDARRLDRHLRHGVGLSRSGRRPSGGCFG